MALPPLRLLRLLALLLPGAAAAPPSEHRVIVHFAGEAGGLEGRVRELAARPGVLKAKGLSHVGLAVAECESQEAEERLVRELEEDPAVELATPDSWVYLADGGKQQPGPRPFQDLRQCKAQSGCAALALVGNCCPANDGLMLACCDGPTTQNLVSFKGFHGKYAAAEEGGAVKCNRDHVDESAKFQVFYNDDGTISLRSHFGKYVSADPSGEVIADRDLIGGWERFTLISNTDGTVSLKTAHGKFFVAEEDGSLRANREEARAWELFVMAGVGGPSQRIPNDANFSALWGMHSKGDEDIDGPEAWRSFTGEFSAGIVVAVIDTGIDYTHEDLRENMWHNPGEIPGNGLDDDGNGYVDDVHGADFANEDGDPFDDQMHGTHCAGTIAGVGNNGVGVAGVAWHGVRLMALKFLTATGSGRTSDAVKAIDYAVAHGAKIASNSWGGGGSSAALNVAIERAAAAGMLFVAAAGNSGSDNDEMPNFPSNYPADNVIAVASTTSEGALSGFSCFGATTVDVAAPGSGIFSTVPNQGYKSLSGTSMATPHVSGLAALVWMYRPALEMSQVKDIILGSVEDVETLHGKVATGGRISARRALKAASALEPPRPPIHAPVGLQFRDVDPRVGVLAGTVTIQAAEDESDVDYYKVYFVSTAGFQLDAVGNVTATGAKLLEVVFDAPVVPPKFAAGLVAVAGNASGEMAAQLGGAAPNTTVEDHGVPEMGPEAVAWSGDLDVAKGRVSGELRVTRAADESSISHYNVYWADAAGAKGPLLGSIPAIGFRAPNCTGEACGLIRRNGSSGRHSFERKDYGDNEEANIVASGPGSVVVTFLDTEDYYDTLTVGATQLSGQPEVPLEIELPGGPTTISWRSDSSITASGWAFELVQTGVEAVFELEATEPLRSGLLVVPAFGRTELLPAAKYVEVADREGSPEPAAAAAGAKARLGSPGPASAVTSPSTPAASAQPKPRRPAPAEGDAEPWLRPPRRGAGRQVWPAPGGAGLLAAGAAQSRRHLKCSLLVPGLDASAVGPELRRAVSRALAAGLPSVEEADLRVVRVLAAEGAGGGKHWPPRRKGASKPVVEQKGKTAIVEFEVEAPAGARANFLDRVEARLILLGQGGASAGHFSEAFLTALGRAGAKLPPGTLIERVELGEPQQVLPRKAGRHLSAGVAVGDRGILVGSEDEAMEATALDATGAAAIAAALCLAAAVAAALALGQCRGGKATKALASLEGVHVQGGSL